MTQFGFANQIEGDSVVSWIYKFFIGVFGIHYAPPKFPYLKLWRTVDGVSDLANMVPIREILFKDPT